MRRGSPTKIWESNYFFSFVLVQYGLVYCALLLVEAWIYMYM